MEQCRESYKLTVTLTVDLDSEKHEKQLLNGFVCELQTGNISCVSVRERVHSGVYNISLHY